MCCSSGVLPCQSGFQGILTNWILSMSLLFSIWSVIPWYYLLSLIMILWSLSKMLLLSMISIGFSVSLVSYIKSPIVFVTVMLWSFYLKFSSLSSSPYYCKCCLVFSNLLFFCFIIALPRSDFPDFCFFGIYKMLKFFNN